MPKRDALDDLVDAELERERYARDLTSARMMGFATVEEMWREVRESTHRERAAQGLPPTIQDPVVAANIAAIWGRGPTSSDIRAEKRREIALRLAGGSDA